MNAVAHDEEYNTTVLSDDYAEYRDTVVDQVIAFDPSLFQGAQGEMAQQAQRPTWVSAGTAAVMQAQSAPSPAAQPAPQPIRSQPQPTWTQANPGASSVPAGYNPEEDTWVLGTPPVAGSRSTMQSATAATMAAAPNYAPIPAAAPSSTWQTAPRTTPSMMAAADSKPAKTNPLLIGVIIGLAIVGIVAIVVALFLAFGPKESSKPADTSAGSASSPAAVVTPVDSSSSASSTTSGDPEKSNGTDDPNTSNGTTNKQGPGSPVIVGGGNGRASTEAEFYDKLTEFYNKAGELDTSVRQCAEDFNNYYAVEDKAVRNSKSGVASSLKSRIDSLRKDLKALEIPFMSKNADAHGQLCELYDCLYNRINVIDEAWKTSLLYEKPKDHESEILKPIRDQQENGNDKYYTRFNELYPTINLVKP